jgi:hypothetical protein
LGTVSDFNEVRSAVTEYVRAYIRALVRRGMSYAAIGKELGCTHAYVSQLDNPDKYPNSRIGPEVEHRLAELLHGGSVDGLRRAALLMQGGVPVVAKDSATGKILELPASSEHETRLSPSSVPPDRPKRRGGGTRAR